MLLIELLALYWGWQFFSDGPLAFYIAMGLWVAWRLALLAIERGKPWRPVCFFGMFLGLSQAGCGLTYAADGRSFVCDKGTGLPISSLVLAGAAGVAIYYWRGK